MAGVLLPVMSIFFSALLCIVFFVKKRIKLFENSIYGVMLVTVLVDSILVSIVQLGTGVYGMDISLLFINMINKLDFMVLIIYTNCVFLYTMLITQPQIKDKIKPIINGIVLTDLLFYILIVVTQVELISDGTHYSIEGFPILITSAICGIYLIASVGITLLNIKQVTKRHIPILSIIGIALFLFIIFKMNPYLIVISATLTFVNYIMYFTIQNPDVKMLEQMELARDQAEKANHAKSDFLSSMSHEIRTPLNAIVGLSEDNLNYEDQVPKEVVENSRDIINASQTLLEIVGNILDINKIEANKMEVVENPYNFKEEIENMCKITETRIGEKNILFHLNIADDIPYELIGDKGKVKEIINNLLTNSIKYTEEGMIELNIKCINDLTKNISTIIVSCKDTGRGIKAEYINKLFQKFERLEVEKNTTTEGTGLGLAITKALVEMMGGTINVQSQFGQGSLFMVNIPQKISKMSRPLTEANLVNATFKGKNYVKTDYQNKKVLIVDDNKLNIKVARKALQDFNLVLDECYDGQECLDKVKEGNEYDLILMDIMMPNMSGEIALEKLKENPNFNIPTIALTADAIAGAKEKYLAEGFIDYIAKPFSKDQIKEKLDIAFKDDLQKNDDGLIKYDPHIDRFKDSPAYVLVGNQTDDENI